MKQPKNYKEGKQKQNQLTMGQETMTQTTTSRKIFNFLTGTSFLFLITLSLFHVFFESNSSEYLKLKKDYKPTFDKLHQKSISLVNDFNEGKLTKDEFVKQYNNHHDIFVPTLKEISRKRDYYKQQHYFLGRKSFHFWLAQFGLVTALLFFSIKSLRQSLVIHGNYYKSHFFSLAGIIVGLFWLIHLLFLTQNDFHNNSYISIIIICSSICSIPIYFLTKFWVRKDIVIKMLSDLVYRIKNKHYNNLIYNALYAEEASGVQNPKKSTGECVKEFEKDIEEVFETSL